FRLEKPEPLRLGVPLHADDVVAAHRHVAVVLPSQTLDGCAVTRTVGIDPFRGEDLAEVARPNLLRRRKFLLDELRCLRLAEPTKGARYAFFRRIVSRHDRSCRLDTDIELGSVPRHHPPEMASDLFVERVAPVELSHAGPPSRRSWMDRSPYA